jgi:tRNA-Thr(GGU) m(6)t(6)A37 methyltransferase TsaA
MVGSARKPLRMARPGLVPVGLLHSSLRDRKDAPNFYTEGAPDAILEIYPAFRRALYRIRVGDELIVITWLHRANRSLLRTHPESDMTRPLLGVFLTRSPDRPNPLGLHRCRVKEVTSTGLRIGPIEAIDGTPVVDIKPVVDEADDS